MYTNLTMTPEDILKLRLQNEQLTQRSFKTPQEVVGWFGAVQSQDYANAKWAVGQRIPNVFDEDMEEAFNAGEILRTHVMRPTWHFVAPQDIRWIIQLTAPRVNVIMNYYNKQMGIDTELRQKGNAIIAKALEGGKSLIREELGEAIEQHGILAKGQRLGHFMMNAELDAIICSGPRRGKQFTYMLIEERAPRVKKLSMDEALAELVKRYFQSHGPATVKDFVWWSGLTTGDVKKGIAMQHPHLRSFKYDSLEYWYFDTVTKSNATDAAYLLPNYDEYTIAYKERDLFYPPADAKTFDQRENPIFNHTLVMHGRIVGMWRRPLQKKRSEIEVMFLKKLNAEEEILFQNALQKYSSFLKIDLKLNMRD